MTTIALIDVAHIFRSAWHATQDEPLSVAFDYTIRAVSRVAYSNKYTHVVCCFDAPPYNRKEIYAEYKANREKPDVAMVEQYKRVAHKLGQMGIRRVKAKGYEADDCIATLVKHARSQGWKTVIYSADKDLMQLIDNDTTMVSTRTGDAIDLAAVKEKFGVGPSQLGDLLALTGDSSDNVPGCPGVGAKTAAKLLGEYGDLVGVLAADTIAGKVGAALRENEQQILVSRELVRLQTDAPIVWAEVIAPVEPSVETPVQTTNPEDRGFEAEARESIAFDSGPETEPAPPSAPSEPTSGDRLIGGALSAKAERPLVAMAPPVTVAPKRAPGAIERASEESGPGIVRAGTAASIELRPGLSMTANQFKLIEAMANRFHGSGMYKRKFDSVDAIFTIMELGLELGMAPQVALQNFHMIEGRPAMAAHFLIARAEADSNCEWFECVEETDTSVTYATKKRKSGRELTFTYTMRDAEMAGMLKNHNWKTRPREMLRKTAGSQAARLWYPGACAGLYSLEEMGFIEEDAA